MKFTLSALLVFQALAGFSLSAALSSRAASGLQPGQGILRPAYKRMNSMSSVPLGPAKFTPKTSVTLRYEGVGGASAQVRARMKRPAILLETIDAISEVHCSDAGVVISFSAADDYKTCLDAWRAKNFIIVTNHANGCDDADERGIFVVKGLARDDDTLTLVADATRAELRDHMEEAIIDFEHPGTAAVTKRSISGRSRSQTADLSGSTLISTEALSIVARAAKLESAVSLAGHAHYDLLRFELVEFYVDLDYSAALHLNVSTAVKSHANTGLYSYSPLTLSISALRIPGILDVGPSVGFALGVEFATTGAVKASVDFVSSIRGANVHLDFLDGNKTSATGWRPETSVDAEIDAKVQLQLNPYAVLSVGVDVNLLNGMIDVSAGVKAKPSLVNAFAVDLKFSYVSETGVTLAKPAPDQCTNGAWFASTFHFVLMAFATQFYRKTLLTFNHPIYKSQCWNLFPPAEDEDVQVTDGGDGETDQLPGAVLA
ncbi:hypothetical protein CTA2_7535 [Colletotrichum tanaceti]|uniref:DUF7029 domain-containing protein n=1 Tax=Colletotrichum tanaceti TaxID=1306861 RepID=A0A4U6XCA5_9PEZI|nr:hypothetical protein CTA2_7535 [Colletotrichum tanaceti]TKW53361.1 hypothetical protein CTA1_7650 [Colletotrichum tanaceti]